MDFAWFLYTIAIIMVAIMAACTSMTVWVLTNRRDCLVGATGFVLYALDVAIILFDEYERSKPGISEYFIEGLTHPVAQIALRTGLICCLWLWIAMRVHAKVGKRIALGFAACVLVILIACAPVTERFSGVARTMLFWGFSDLMVIGAFAFVFWWRDHRASETDRISIDRSRTFFIPALIISIVMLVEDVYFIVLLDTSLLPDFWQVFFWHLTERNLSENVLMVFCAVKMVLYDRQIMQIFSQHPMESAGTAKGDGTLAHRDFESRLLRFADDYGMSKREREVLRLAIDGKDTQNIANELFISTGTVKAHMHRIYTKAGVDSRQELVEAFWKH